MNFVKRVFHIEVGPGPHEGDEAVSIEFDGPFAGCLQHHDFRPRLARSDFELVLEPIALERGDP